jgi:uncharacterized membrane protein YbhN (UPF0104 family)
MKEFQELKTFALLGIKIVFTALLLLLVFYSIDLAIFWKTICSADLTLIAIASFLFFPFKLLDAYRWYFLLRRFDRVLSFRLIVRQYLLGQLSSFVLPGQISGDLVRVITITRGRHDKMILVMSAVLDKIACLFGVAVLSLTGKFGTGPVSQFKWVYVTATGLVIGSSALIFFLGRFRSGVAARWIIRFASFLPFVRKKSSIALTEWFGVARLSPSSIFVVMAFGVGLQLCYIIGSYIIARSMAITINPLDWAAITGVVAVAQVLPVTIGGLGVREGLSATILGLYSVPWEQATAFSLGSFVLIVLLTAISWLVVTSFSFVHDFV